MFRKLALVGAIILAHFEISPAGPTVLGLDPRNYGVVIGAGQSATVRLANHTAMKNCLQAAQATGQAVALPADTIEIDVPNKGSAAASTFKITKDLQVTGTDPELSKLKFGPESPTYEYSGFYAMPNTDIVFTDCILEGPADPGPNGEFNKRTYALLQTGQSGQTYNTPGSLRFLNVKIAGEWYVAMQGAHGDALLEFIDCDVTAYTQCVAWSATYNYGKRVHARNTYFHDAGLPGKGHLLYLSPVVSFNLDNCRFGGNFRYAIHHYGSGTLLPQYAIVQNSVVESTCNDGIETTNNGVTQIINTVFNNPGRSVSFKGDTVIQGCTFNPGSEVTTYDMHTGVNISISQSTFNSSRLITSNWRNCVWQISDCDFNGTNSSTAIGNGALGSQYYIDNCRFNGTWNRGVFVSGGTYSVTNCSFRGSYVEGAVVYEDPPLLGPQLAVNNCVFQQTGRSIWAKSGLSAKVTGSGNSFSSRQPEGRVGMYQLLQLRSAPSPTTIASASQIAPTFNYGTYNVTGTAQINYIRVGGSEVINEMCAGRLTLISSGWSLSNTGNIRPRSTSRRPVGAAVVLVRNGQTNLWVE